MREAIASNMGKWIMSTWKWMMSKRSCWRLNSLSMVRVGGEVGLQWRGIEPDRLVAHGDQFRPGVQASALENKVTSWPSSTRASHRWATTRSVPPLQFRRNGLVQGSDLSDFHG